MKDYSVTLPTKLFYGAGSINSVGEKVASYGKKVFLMVDPFLRGGVLASKIISSIKEKGVEVIEFYDIVPNPRNTTIDGAIETVKQEKCDVIAAVGGGSAIDSAKAVALVAVHGGKCWEYTERLGENVKRPNTKGLPLIVVPTTSGTGTEATPFAVINNPELHLKCTIVNHVTYPDIAIVDPEILVSKPPKLTALTAIDTFAHAFEAYISIHATPWVEMVALESIRLFAENIRECYKNGSNIEARAKMAFSCSLGGIAIANAGVTIPHALGQPLSALTDAPHGGTIAACINQVIEWTLPVCEDKFGKIAEIFDPSLCNLSAPEKARKLPEILRALFAEINVTDTFGSYGLKEDQIGKFADIVFTSFNQDLLCHPKKIQGKQDVIDIIKMCF